jgi:hypothetical protein
VATIVGAAALAVLVKARNGGGESMSYVPSSLSAALLCCIIAACLVSVAAALLLPPITAVRRGVTDGALGVRNAHLRRRREHAVADVSAFASAADFVAALPSRSARQSLSTKLRRSLKHDGVRVRSRPLADCTDAATVRRVYAIILSHQRRMRSYVPHLVALLRLCSFYLSHGVVDEYFVPSVSRGDSDCKGDAADGDAGSRKGGTENAEKGETGIRKGGFESTDTLRADVCVAVSLTAVRGQTVRGLWFYQSSVPSEGKYLLWFAAFRLSGEVCVCVKCSFVFVITFFACAHFVSPSICTFICASVSSVHLFCHLFYAHISSHHRFVLFIYASVTSFLLFFDTFFCMHISSHHRFALLFVLLQWRARFACAARAPTCALWTAVRRRRRRWRRSRRGMDSRRQRRGWSFTRAAN